MWKEYSRAYLKNNRAAGAAVALAAFISALLLSLLLGIFYNLWQYEVERIEGTEGAWHSRIETATDGETLETVRQHPNVADAAAMEAGIELRFHDKKLVFDDTARIAELLGVSPEAVSYHYGLLAMYLIRSPQDTAPRLIFPLFLGITGLAAVSLLIILYNSFAVTMNARIHQFGIFSSVGATPKQIRLCLLQEVAALCAVPFLAGTLLGIGGSWGVTNLTNVLLGTDVPGRHTAVFTYHPLLFLLTLLLTAVTTGIAAWLPAHKLSRLTPLEAIRNTGEWQLKRRRRSPVLAALFGIEGELAGNALKAQRKALRTASLSLILSFLAFTLMQCFFTLSAISTRETYFERYQDSWDVMLTVRDAEVDSFGEIAAVRALPGVETAVAYQRAAAKRIVTEEEMSGEMRAMGGFSRASGTVTQTEEGFLVSAPIVILDDAGFLGYCEQLGISPTLEGAILLNRIRDVTNPDFRHPQYMPYLNGQTATTTLRPAAGGKADSPLPVLACTVQPPVLREEYATLDHYELVHFVPASLWRACKDRIGGGEGEVFLRILAEGEPTLAELTALQAAAEKIVGVSYTAESENRIAEYELNDRQIGGMMALLGGFCVLLAVIGVGSVFSNTLGFVRQRRREFARYMSVGMTPAELKKMFCLEALVIAGRPVLITLPVTTLTTWLMLRASYMEVEVFLAEAPLVPVGVFLLAMVGTVALAYYLGWRSVRNISLAAVLRDDTML